MSSIALTIIGKTAHVVDYQRELVAIDPKLIHEVLGDAQPLTKDGRLIVSDGVPNRPLVSGVRLGNVH